MSLLSLQDINISFGGPLLFQDVNFNLESGERVALLGRNGTGKTTLLKVLNGDQEPDAGLVVRRQGLTTALLTQEVPQDLKGTVLDLVTGGLGEIGHLLSEYHQAGSELAVKGNDNSVLKRMELIQQQLESKGGWHIHQRVDRAVMRMNLPAETEFKTLSAGMKRRVLLARALVSEPDVLMLDEPTNHMDIEAITWLEEFLTSYNGALLFVTHDRVLVQKVATRIIDIDRGRLSSWDCNYELYLERKAAYLDSEEIQWEKFDKKLLKEEAWLRRGVKARRARDEGRKKKLLDMRENRRRRREQVGQVQMKVHQAQRSGRMVLETKKISFAYEDRPIVKDFTTTVMRGDRVGIIGPNGSGKTTLLRLLLGELQPQEGNTRLGVNLEIVYFDQMREQLEDEETVIDNVADGNDYVLINGNRRHVIGYLQDFLFSPERSRCRVKVLSGGERNRLLLAKFLARPSNLLVLDEPTNDLDVETLELLEDLLMDYNGTLLLVSHDRAFLDNVVTSTLVLEGEGRIGEYIGGYKDWLLQRSQEENPVKTKESKKPAKSQKPKLDNKPRKLTYKEERELEGLPQLIEELENRKEELFSLVSEPGFYKKEGKVITETNEKLAALEQELTEAYQRWESLEELKSARENNG